MPLNTLNKLSFAQGINTAPFFGNTKALGVWKEALTDAELRSLTYPTPTAATFDLDFNTIATDFTFTRNSEATFVNAQGLIQSTNELGAEEITNGSFDTDSNWSKQAGWTISGGTANANMILGGNGNIYQSALVVGKTYELTFTVSNYIQGYIRNVSQTSPIPLYSSNGTFTERFVATNANLFMNATTVESTQLSIDNVSVKEYITETNTPRLDYSTGAEAFLLEPQRTNLVTYSNDFSNAIWIKQSGITITPNNSISPDGTQNGSRAFFNSNNLQLRYLITTVGDTVSSLYIKGLNGETIGFGVSGAESLVTLNGEWQRFEQYKSSNISKITINTFNGATARDIEIYGAQLEEGSYPTSLIPTSGTTVTRNQELCYAATPVINSEEGVLYAEISKQMQNNDVIKLISLNSGSDDDDSVTIGFITGNNIYARVKANGVNELLHTSFSSNANQFYKVALKYKSGNISLWINGVEIATSTSTFSFNLPLSELSFDFNGNNGLSFFGITKGLKVYPKALSDVELQDLTTI